MISLRSYSLVPFQDSLPVLSHRRNELNDPTAKNSPLGAHATDVIACSQMLLENSSRPYMSHTLYLEIQRIIEVKVSDGEANPYSYLPKDGPAVFSTRDDQIVDRVPIHLEHSRIVCLPFCLLHGRLDRLYHHFLACMVINIKCVSLTAVHGFHTSQVHIPIRWLSYLPLARRSRCPGPKRRSKHMMAAAAMRTSAFHCGTRSVTKRTWERTRVRVSITIDI